MMVDLGSYPKLFHDKMTDPGVHTGSLTQHCEPGVGRLPAWEAFCQLPLFMQGKVRKVLHACYGSPSMSKYFTSQLLFYLKWLEPDTKTRRGVWVFPTTK